MGILSAAKVLSVTGKATKGGKAASKVDYTSLKRINAPKEVDYNNLTAIKKVNTQQQKDLDEVQGLNDAGLISPKEYESMKASIENPIDFSVDTRGGGQQYNGTSNPIEVMDEYTYNPSNIYGQGFYTTDATDIAKGYSRKGRGKTPTIYKVNKKNDLNFLDMEEPLTPALHRKLRRIDDEYDNVMLEDVTNLREYYDERRLVNPNESIYDIQDALSSFQSTWEGMGYQGLRHKGGLKTGNTAHNVEIIFDAKSHVDLEKVYMYDK